MRILMVASEAVPFAKTGGLADVAGALPAFLRQLGHDVRVVMPYYSAIIKTDNEIRQTGGPLSVPMGIIGELWAGILERRLPKTDIPIYFIDFRQYFDRSRIYNEEDGSGFLDNDNRYAFLSRAALQLCKAIGFSPDVVHVNDWHTAVVPVLLNTIYKDDPLFSNTASLLTIHNMEYQGRYYAGLMDVLDVGWEQFHPGSLEYYGKVNLLKGGLCHATLINAVSPSYAREIHTTEFGHGLESVVQARTSDIVGILNGMDYDIWNPETDAHIAAHYSVDDLQGKAICKRDLQRRMGLPERDVPLFGMVTRLVHQKGVDVIAEAIDRLMSLDIQLVVLGDGEDWANKFYGALPARFPGQLASAIRYDDALARQIEAGADFFLMPSRFEPCGLNQMYSLRYGTLPIVHAVGGLRDTVENFDESTHSGTGFVFNQLTPQALFDTVGWATYTWYHHRHDVLPKLIRRAMSQRFTWEDAAERYDLLYRAAVARKTR